MRKDYIVVNGQSQILSQTNYGQDYHSENVSSISMPRPIGMASAVNKHLPKKSVWDQLMERGGPELGAYLENNVISNVAVNMMFRQGRDLHTGLIDASRLHQVIEKVKSMAASQHNSKAIDFQAVSDFV